jgi:flagellar protein FliT
MEQEILNCYQAISEASARMLAAARAGEWDALVAAEADCARHVDALRRISPEPPKSDRARRHRIELIRTVLAHDAEVRKLTQPWLGRIENFLRGRVAQRRIEDAYR